VVVGMVPAVAEGRAGGIAGLCMAGEHLASVGAGVASSGRRMLSEDVNAVIKK